MPPGTLITGGLLGPSSFLLTGGLGAFAAPSLAPRRAAAFESIDGSLSVTFSLHQYEWSSAQGLRIASHTALGADYGVDQLGFQPAPKGYGQESVRFLLVGATQAALEQEMGAVRSTVYRIGLGKLWRVDSDGTARWAYARAVGAPTFMVASGQAQFGVVPVTLEFQRASDWFGAAATTGTNTVTESPKTVAINNPGDLPVKAMVFRLRANGAAGFTNPSLANDENGYSIATTRDSASAADEVRIDTERLTVEYSDDDGATYADDFDLVSLGAVQVGFMVLEPGSNDFTVTCGGTPNFDLEWSFYAAYE